MMLNIRTIIFCGLTFVFALNVFAIQKDNKIFNEQKIYCNQIAPSGWHPDCNYAS
jgi:hypothetical protein